MSSKGTGEKRNPRRLFSFDSIKTSSSRRLSTDTDDPPPPPPLPTSGKHSRFMTLSSVDELSSARVLSPPPIAPSALQKRSESPLGFNRRKVSEESHSRFATIDLTEDAETLVSPPSIPASRSKRSGSPFRQKASASTLPALTTNVTVGPETGPPKSPSRVRWDSLRQHVIPVPNRPASPSSQQSSGTSTPRHPKFPRLGLKQVVEHAREVAGDETRRIALEVQKSCWNARYNDLPGSKIKSDYPHYNQTAGSSLYLPFMSSTSLIGTANSGQAIQQSGKKHDLRRPQSQQSLNTLGNRPPGPTLKGLYQTLYYLSNLPVTPQLPHESLVMSTLLSVFLSENTDEERWYAIETFEIIAKSWEPPDESGGIQRCMWCVEAAVLIPASPTRSRIIQSLWKLVVPAETSYPTTTPQSLRVLAQGLFMLLANSAIPAPDDARAAQEMLHHLSREAELDSMAVEEDYNALYVDGDDPRPVRDAVLLEGLAQCLENSTIQTVRFLLRSMLEPHWKVSPFDNTSFSPLLGAIATRRLRSFTRIFLSLLHSGNADTQTNEIIAGLIDTRVIPEVEALSPNIAVLEIKRDMTRIVIEMLGMENSARWAGSMISHWHRDAPEWKQAMDQGLKFIVSHSPWPVILKTCAALLQGLPEDVRKVVFIFLIPIFNDQLVSNPPPYPSAPLTALMASLSQMYPPIFYKPLFQCAASTKEFAVVNHLSVISVLSRFLSDFWVRDAEMVAVALMSGEKEAGRGEETRIPWGKARLGQSVLLVEVTGKIQTVRKEKEEGKCPDDVLLSAIKFCIALEARLGVLLDAKERTTLVPLSQRMLFSMLFREIRLLTRSLKSAPWLSRVVSWIVNYHLDDDVNDDPEEELSEAVGQIQGLYIAAQNSAQASRQRRSTMVFSSSMDSLKDEGDGQTDLSKLFTEKQQLLNSLAKGFIPRAMKLLVAVSAVLTPADHKKIGPVLWDHYLESLDPSALNSVSFLIMQCAEKAPLDLLASIEVQMQSSDEDVRLTALRKFSTLISWRFQIMSQNIITDRSHRPFKLAKGPLPFVATDMGTTHFVPDESAAQTKDSLPAELRKRLAEIGWTDDDGPIDQQQEWIQTPMMLLPSSQLDRLDVSFDVPSSPNVSPAPSPQPSPQKRSPGRPTDEFNLLLRRNSSSGGPMFAIKRKSIFVPSLTQIFPRLSMLVSDPSFKVAAAARGIIIDLMRNDPALLTRPILDLFAGDHKDLSTAICSLRTFLHVSRVLPPAFAHNVWNNLAGFLKYLAKHGDTDDALHEYGRTIPILAKLVNQVSDLSIREIRRAKIEPFVIPSGSLWFTDTTPNVPMFPRTIGQVNPFEDVPARVVSVTMIRISQNMLFLSMLRRNHQDVQTIRKSMTRLVLPSSDRIPDASPLELKDFIPRKNGNKGRGDGTKLKRLSLVLSRSHIPLVAQVFRSMSRHLSDRNELALLVDGLNRILLTHGTDLDIVSQSVIAFMVASTRFRRLFASGGGYTLFMPALIKVYAESERHEGIRHAIEYAANRFYAHHRESFVFQSLDVMSHITMLPATDGEWVAKQVYLLFSTLRYAVPPNVADAAGIRDVNKLQEREALIISTAEEKPQTFLASLRKAGNKSAVNLGQPRDTVDLPQEYASHKLSLDDFVRLFLTVIAHDFSIARAEYFLKFLRFITPSLYHSSTSARTILQEGIDALGSALSKMTPKNKSGDAEKEEANFPAILESQLMDNSKKPSNILAMQLDYLSLVVAFSRSGGILPPPASHRVVELVKTMLRDTSGDVNAEVSSFIIEFTRTSLAQEKLHTVKAVIYFLNDIAPIVSAYALTVNFSGVFDVIKDLCANSFCCNDPPFGRLIINQICAAGLSACETAASDSLLFNLPWRTAFVSLLAEAIFLRGGDIIVEIEKRPSTYDFLAGIVLPLIMSMKTRAQLDSEGARTEAWHRTAQEQAWARLLAYAMSACRNVHYATQSSHSPERSKSQDRRRSSSASEGKAQLSTFITAIQVIKIIIIRAERDLSSSIPDIWSRLGSFLKTMLAEGNADFAVRSQEYSPSPSPSPSPRASLHFDQTYPGLDFRTTLASPRIVDYCLWSVFELLCLHRTPLMLQMRTLIQENLVNLDHDLHHQIHALQGQRESRRVSVFSKPRRASNAFATPENSPRLRPSNSLTPHDFNSPAASFDNPNYQRILPVPARSPQQEPPKILHLGLISNPSFPMQRSSSPGSSSGARLMARSTKIKSLSLIKATYQRIRTAQLCMGYHSLLPLPSSPASEREDVSLGVWTVPKALCSVLDETRQLLEEFEETFEGNSSMVMVDSDQSFGFAQ